MPRVLRFHDMKLPTTTTNYLAVVGDETMWPGAKALKREEIKDDLSDMILIVENNGLGVHWMEPRDLTFASMNFGIDTPDGVSSWYTRPSVVTTDDAVRTLSRSMTPETLRAALTVAGGETIANGHDGWTVIADGRDRERKVP